METGVLPWNKLEQKDLYVSTNRDEKIKGNT